MSETATSYTQRGQRVPRISDKNLVDYATVVAGILSINRQTIKSIETFIESLSETLRVTTHIIEDSDWPMPPQIKALCDPNLMAIFIPESLYIKIAVGDAEAIGIFFHELGHLLLGHKAILHYDTDDTHSYEEDAEFQADMFANVILKIMGIGDKAKQMSLI